VTQGRNIIRASWIGTAVFTVSAIAATISPDTFGAINAVLSLALFFVGCVLFFLAYARAVSRSRTDAIGIGGLFFLADSAPRPVQIHLLASLAVEAVVAIASASLRPFTNTAFGVLVPMYGLGLCGLWASRYGTFESRSE
jgi:hypothetical protein